MSTTQAAERRVSRVRAWYQSTKRFIAKRRAMSVAIVAALILIVMVAAYGVSLCVHNSRVERGWDSWTSHLTGPPPWTPPSNDLHNFAGDQTYRSLGLTSQLWGYKDGDGAIVIPAQFAACGSRFYDGLAWAHGWPDERSGYINPDGSWAIIVPGQALSHFCGGMGMFQTFGTDRFPLVGFVNRAGDVVVPPRYRHAELYVDGYVVVYERTWVGRFCDRLGYRLDISLTNCLSTRSIVLDRNGNRVPMPKR